MVQPRPEERITLDQVLKLVDKLSLEDQEQLRRTLSNKNWGKEWHQLIKDVEEDNRREPPLSDDEIMAEVKAVREEMKAERAQQSGN